MDQIRRIRLFLSLSADEQQQRHQKALIPSPPHLNKQNLLVKRLPQLLKLQAAIKGLAEGVNLAMLSR